MKGATRESISGEQAEEGKDEEENAEEKFGHLDSK
jgi:hypothetical protein